LSNEVNEQQEFSANAEQTAILDDWKLPSWALDIRFRAGTTLS
jgi:hypothetical protein